MNFFDSMNSVLNEEKTLTTNGAVAYRTSGKKLLDFNFSVRALRNRSEAEIVDRYAKVFFEDKNLAIKYLFYLGDVREGLGERRTFRICFEYLAKTQPEIVKAVMSLIPEYTRWDNLVRLIVEDNVAEEVVAIIKEQLEKDIINMKIKEPVSLLAKWLPSQNTSSIETKKLGVIVATKLGYTPRQYRKILTSLRKYLDVVEVKMSKKDWSDIDYNTVPSRANLIYNSAFLKNDEERRREYLAKLEKGEAKINAAVLQPHEIAYKYRVNSRIHRGETDKTLEALWKALPNLMIENTLIVRDGSGSMTWGSCGTSGATALDVATALAIYMSERNSGGWRNKFITFSANPEIVDLSQCSTLRDKIELSLRKASCSNTNIYSTMKLILDTAVRNKMTQEEMPKTIVICSDMQFDGWEHNFDESLFDSISREYKSYGYYLPKICFWNLSGCINNTVPMQQNELGLILCSGFSVQILKMFMSGKTDPYELLVEQLNSERYKAVEEALKKLL